jgi:integrase
VFFPAIDGKRTTRKLGNFNELNQQQADARASDMLRSLKLQVERNAPTVMTIINRYRTDKLSKLRHSTQKANNSWLRSYIEPVWGETLITELQPRVVELWLESLPLAPKTRGHLRELLHRLVDYAMWCGSIPVGTNPISLVTVRGSSKRQKQPRSLTVEEFRTLSKHLMEPFKTMVLLQLCLGLRVSELLALRWKDVDWIGSRLNVEQRYREPTSRYRQDGGLPEGNDSGSSPDFCPTSTETDHGVPRRGGLDLRFPGETGETADQLHRVSANLAERGRSRWNRQGRDAQHEAHVPLLARCRGNCHHCAAEAHAALRHPNYAQRLRGCGDG